MLRLPCDAPAAAASRLPHTLAAVAFVVATVTLLVFAPAWHHGFLAWDDETNFVETRHWQGFSAGNVAWAFTTFHTGPWQPLSWLSYMLDYTLFGPGPLGPHVTNTLLQALAGGLLLLLAFRLLARALPGLAERPRLHIGCAAFAALLWAVHPQRVESVAWATERRDVLSAVFLLASLLAWLRYTDGAVDQPYWRQRHYWLTFCWFVASLLAKATAMGFALVLVLLDVFPLRRDLRRHVSEKLPFVLFGAVIAAVALLGQKAAAATVSTDAYPLWARALTAAYAAWRYLFATLLPFDLRAHYERPPAAELLQLSVLVPAGLAAVGVFALVKGGRRRPALLAAFGSYLVLLAPVSGLATVGNQLVADRYSHQPGLALSLLAAGLAGRWLLQHPARARAATFAGAAALLTFGLTANHLTSLWGEPLQLWPRVLTFEPRNHVANGQIGIHLYRLGEHDKARPFLAQAVQRSPHPAGIACFAALNDVRAGQLQDAEQTLAWALERAPREVEGWQARAELCTKRNDRAGAEAAFAKALAIDPHHTPTRRAYAEFLAANEPGRAEALARELLAEAPHDGKIAILLGSLCAQRGALDEAESLFSGVLAQAPRSVIARSKLAEVRLRRGDTATAERLYREAVELAPQAAEPARALATLRARAAEHAEAAARRSATPATPPR